MQRRFMLEYVPWVPAAKPGHRASVRLMGDEARQIRLRHTAAVEKKKGYHKLGDIIEIQDTDASHVLRVINNNTVQIACNTETTFSCNTYPVANFPTTNLQDIKSITLSYKRY